MRKTDKKAIVPSKTNLKKIPTNVKILPFNDGSKKEIIKKEPNYSLLSLL